jgi:hypothetical protein
MIFLEGVEASWGPQLELAKALGHGRDTIFSLRGNWINALRAACGLEEKEMPQLDVALMYQPT